LTSLNVNGMGNNKKKKEIAHYTKESDVLLLQETHMTPNDIDKLYSWKTRDIISSFGTSASKGVSIIGNENVELLETSQHNGRIIAGTIKWKGKELHVINIYAPNVSGTIGNINEYKGFLQRVENTLKDNAHQKIIMGDINIIMNRFLDAEKDNIGSFYQQLVDEWTRILDSHEMVDAWRELYPQDAAFTYNPYGARGTHIYRRLDYCFVSSSLTELLVNVTHTPNHLSDHAKVTVTFKGKDTKNPFRMWKHKDDLLCNPDYIEAIKEAIGKAAQEAEESNLDEQSKWEYTKYKIRQKARAMEKKIFNDERMALEEAKDTLKTFQNEGETDRIRAALNTIKRLESEKTKRLIRAANVKWAEENEKSTQFFFNRIKQGKAESNVITLEKEGNIIKDEEVNTEIYAFYSKLYAHHRTEKMGEMWKAALREKRITDEIDIRILNNELSLGEIKNTLFKQMKNGKAPGNDGLTVGLYRAMWEQVKQPMWASFQMGLRKGELSLSQRQSVIRLIKKKDRDPLKLKNWRPISLMNVDTKLLSRALAERLTQILPGIISKEQLGFVKGRRITEGNRLIDYLINKYEKEQKRGMIAGIDFEKAFDSISHEHIEEVLKELNFPKRFILMFKTLYKNPESCVINNSTTTPYFPLGRSCRQGDPIAPYLFIIALEPLLRMLNRDEDIIGMQTPAGNIKMTVYADDLTLLLSNEESLRKSFRLLEDFQNVSGLKVNQDKTEILSIEDDDQIDDREARTLTVTGITHALNRNLDLMEEKNFGKIIGKLTTTLNLWKTRNLTLLGRVQVVKAQALSLLQYVGNNLETPEWALKDINKLIYKFIWKGPDRLSREALEQRWEEGGMAMPQPQTINWALKLQWLKRARVSDHPWTAFLEEEKAGMALDMNRPLTEKKLKSLPYLNFNKSIVAAAVKIQKTYNEQNILPTSTISQNKYIKGRNAKVLDQNRLTRKNITMIKHLKDCGGEWITGNRLQDAGLNMMERMEWTGAINVIRPIIERVGLNCAMPGSLEDRIRNPKYEATIAGTEMGEDDLTYKNIIKATRNSTPGQIPARRRRACETHKIEIPEELFIKARKIYRDTRSRDFCYRLINGLLYAANDLHKFGIYDSPKCPHCETQVQTIEHLLWECEGTRRTYNGLNRQGKYKLSQQSRLQSIHRDEEAVLAYKLKVMHCIYINNILKDSIDANIINSKIGAYIASARVVHEEIDRLPQFYRLWQ